MSKIIEGFRHLFVERTATPVPSLVEAESDAASARADSIRDVRVFIATQAYRDLRAWFVQQIREHAPRPEMGSDVGSCYTFKREGLQAGLDRLDAMVRLAEEKLGDV